MGCGGSKPADGGKSEPAANQTAAATTAAPAQKNAGAPAGGSAAKYEATTPAAAAPAGEELPGKAKFMGAPVVAEISNKGKWFILAFTNRQMRGLSFSARDAETGKILAKSFTDAELTSEKDTQGITHNWPAVFKSINSEVSYIKTGGDPKKPGARVDVAADGVMTLTFKITSSKDAAKEEPLVVKLTEYKEADAIVKYVVDPLCMYFCRKKTESQEKEKDKEKEMKMSQLEAASIIKDVSLGSCTAAIARLTPVIRPLREEATAATKAATDLTYKVAGFERKIKRALQGGPTRHILDDIYEVGGAQWYQHCPWAEDHFPVVNPFLAQSPWIPDLLGRVEWAGGKDVITKSPSDGLPEQAAQILSTMGAVDEWAFNIFDLEERTKGNALFTITYSLFYKYGLVKAFGIDDTILRNWASQVSAGYHANPYHNALHAADVTHIIHFILGPGGLKAQLKLSNEDCLAMLFSAAIHDYDHPGFNNNFHARTASFLSTLYNDRSVLEQHHLACSFEMLRLPKYNVFHALTPEKTKDVRDTIVEVLFATDMSSHAKIFSQFRKRIQDGPDWTAKKDDVRLALSMALKMADISNCARPNHLYQEWAKRIAKEFYNQGDVELKLKMSVSPFMDRRKDATDFSKGQTSFMNYIVIPMFETMGEFLPGVAFSVDFCQQNKQYWTAQK